MGKDERHKNKKAAIQETSLAQLQPEYRQSELVHERPTEDTNDLTLNVNDNQKTLCQIIRLQPNEDSFEIKALYWTKYRSGIPLAFTATESSFVSELQNYVGPSPEEIYHEIEGDGFHVKMRAKPRENEMRAFHHKIDSLKDREYKSIFLTELDTQRQQQRFNIIQVGSIFSPHFHYLNITAISLLVRSIVQFGRTSNICTGPLLPL